MARAETAEARAEECRWAEVAARAELGSLKARFQANREKLAEAREEVKAIRRAAKDAIFLHQEVQRLTDLLAAARVDPSRRSPAVSLRMALAEAREENARLRRAVWVSRTRGEAFRGQLGRLRANGQRLSRRLCEESTERRKALRRSRRHKAAIRSLSRDNARLRKAVRKGQERKAVLETELAEVRASRAVLSKWLYGRRSEQQDKPCSKRRRGQQPGAPGHGRTPRPALEERTEIHEPAQQARVCSGCGTAYVANGERCTRIVEIHVKAHTRRIVRRRPLNGVAAWLTRQGLAVFGGAATGQVLVVDRFSSYKRLARVLDGRVTLAWCWSHQRRDFIDCAAGQPQLNRWCRDWLGRIAAIYRLNKTRLSHCQADTGDRDEGFAAVRRELESELAALFATAERELKGLDEAARQAAPLRSLLNHREGLGVFVDNPRVPMDNNLAERTLRGAVIGRRLSFGSDSEHGARLTALMYSVVETLALNGVDVRRWLAEWLKVCAGNGGRAPPDLSRWLPWSMSPRRRRTLTGKA